jgi:hypothetical protein
MMQYNICIRALQYGATRWILSSGGAKRHPMAGGDSRVRGGAVPVIMRRIDARRGPPQIVFAGAGLCVHNRSRL